MPLFQDDDTPTRRPSAEPPRHLGEFRIESELGRGGMGIVYLAVQEPIGRRVALKVLSLLSAPSPSAAERFHREAEIVAKLEHPNVVRMYAMGQAAGTLYYAMELVEGESLKDRLSRGAIPPREAAEIARGVARALEHAHGSGVVHRDIKPANILLDRAAAPHLTDFGLARGDDSKSLTVSGDLLGTPMYMSPEQASSQKDVGPRSDVYSLGAVLYEALTGSPVIDRNADVFAQLYAVRKIDPVPPSRVNARTPRDLGVIVMRCLEKDPARRYPTAAAVADELDRFLRGEAIQARPPGLRDRFGRFVRRHRGAAVALAAVLVVIAAFAGYEVTRPGWLTLEVTPPDALVRIDGGERLPAGAVRRRPLSSGAHSIRVELRGYVPVDLPWAVSRSESATLPVNLRREQGRLTLVTDPPDCRVTLEGEQEVRLRRLSPIEDEAIDTAAYRATVEKDGFARARLDLALTAGGTLSARVTLAPAAAWTVSEPQGALLAVARTDPAKPPVLAACVESGDIEFFEGATGARTGVGRSGAAFPHPLVVRDGRSASPQLLAVDDSGGISLRPWGSGQAVWELQSLDLGAISQDPVWFPASGSQPPELWCRHLSGMEVIDAVTGKTIATRPWVEEFHSVVFEESKRLVAVAREDSLAVVDGAGREIERIATPETTWGEFTIAAVDLDGDGRREVVAGAIQGRLRAYRTGPLSLLWETEACLRKGTSFAVGVVRSGEAPSIVACCGDEELGIWDAQGRLRGRRTLPEPCRTRLTLADIDGDGVRDLVYGSTGALWVLDLASDRVIAEVPLASPPKPFPAIADLDDDGLLDVALSLSDGTIQVVPGRRGIWSYKTGHTIRRAPLLVDLTGDGTPDVVCTSLDSFAYALEGRTGRLLWKTPLVGQAATTPAVVGGDVVLCGWGGIAERVEGKSGKVAWSYRPAIEGWDVHFHASPLAADVDGDGRMEVVLADWRVEERSTAAPRGFVHCLDAATGAVRWVKEVGGPFAVAPVLLAAGEIMVGDAEGDLVCLDPRDGSEKWREKLGDGIRAEAQWAPDEGDGRALVWTTATHGRVVEVRPGATGARPRKVPERATSVRWGTVAGRAVAIAVGQKAVIASDARTGEELWRGFSGMADLAPPLAVDLDGDSSAEVVVGGSDGRVTCLDGRTGERRWSCVAGAGMEAPPLAADLDGDGAPEIVVAMADGRVRVLSGRGRTWSGEWSTMTGDTFGTHAPGSVGPEK